MTWKLKIVLSKKSFTAALKPAWETRMEEDASIAVQVHAMLQNNVLQSTYKVSSCHFGLANYVLCNIFTTCRIPRLHCTLMHKMPE